MLIAQQIMLIANWIIIIAKLIIIIANLIIIIANLIIIIANLIIIIAKKNMLLAKKHSANSIFTVTSFLISSTIRTFFVRLPRFQFCGASPVHAVLKDRLACALCRPVCCCRRSVYLDNLLFQRSVQPVGGW